MKDVLGYEGKIVVVTGAASGMGAAATRFLLDLGAEVHALDIREVDLPVKQFVITDLKDKRSIDAAVEQLPAKIDALFNCAGILGPPFSNMDTTLINFVGPRHLTEMLLTRIPDGGAVAFISSTAGMGWQKNFHQLNEFLSTLGFDQAQTWLAENPEINNGYMFSKQCITAYTKTKAGELAKRNIRINCISPAPTDTPFMKDLFEQFGKEAAELYLAPCGRYATPEEMAEPLLFLNSHMARFISGHDLVIDFGYAAQVETGQRENLLGV